jgi:transcription elongation factor Elf1
MSNTPELKRCPFCGSEAVQKSEPRMTGTHSYDAVQCANHRCCGSKIFYPVEAWNTRADIYLQERQTVDVESESTSNPWNYNMDEAPRNGTVVLLKVGESMSFDARWQEGFMDSDEQDCGCWVALHEGEHPPCWSEGVCWSSNQDESESIQPTAWMYVPPPVMEQE